HICAFALFAGLTAWIMGPQFSAAPSQDIWALMWLLVGGVTIVLWSIGLLPWRNWVLIVRAEWVSIGCATIVGSVAWAAGSLAQDLWYPLGVYTLRVVLWLFGLFNVKTISNMTKLTIGSHGFEVSVLPGCSGYEGIGFVLVFLSVYLWHFRDKLRFPHALAILPLGAGSIWMLNAVRIAVLILIGSSGWPNIALGGFHSQAGWLSFNAVGLGLVMITTRVPYLQTAQQTKSSLIENVDPTTAYLAPFLLITAVAMVTGAFSAGFEWLYPFRVIAAGIALW